jgi:hypothetical protein
MEDQGKYEHSPEPTTPAKLLSLLEVGRRVMVARLDRHRRRHAKAKHARDQEFHQEVINESELWIQESDLLAAQVRKAVLLGAFSQRGLF